MVFADLIHAASPTSFHIAEEEPIEPIIALILHEGKSILNSAKVAKNAYALAEATRSCGNALHAARGINTAMRYFCEASANRSDFTSLSGTIVCNMDLATRCSWTRHVENWRYYLKSEVDEIFILNGIRFGFPLVADINSVQQSDSKKLLTH